MNYPSLYRDKDKFNVSTFWQWAGTGFVHSVFIFYIPYFTLMTTFMDNSMWSGSVAVYSTMVVAGENCWVGFQRRVMWDMNSSVACFIFVRDEI